MQANQIVFRQELAGIIVLILMIAGSIAASVLVMTSGNGTSGLQWMCIAMVLLFAFLLWNYVARKIIVDELGITHRSLFNTASFSFGEVTKIETKAKLESVHVTSGSLHVRYDLILHSYDKRMTIPIKSFSRKSLKELATLLVIRCVSADIDNGTYLMTKGKMPSVFFKHQ